MATEKERLTFQTERFSETDVRELQGTLTHITQIININWAFTEDGLVVNGLGAESITLTHRKSARAFLDGVLLGYDIGFRNGRFHADD